MQLVDDRPELEPGAVSVPCGPNPCIATANRRQTTHLGGQGTEGTYPGQRWKRQAALLTQAKHLFSTTYCSLIPGHTPPREAACLVNP